MNLLLIILLLGIIAFLIIQLKKKDHFIRAIMEKLNIGDHKGGKDELFTILSRLHMVEFTRLLSRDKFFEKPILDFIFDHQEESRIYLHYTREQEVADQILQQGFHFRYSFYKTADRIINDKLDLVYKHNRNKPYGTFIIVISIGNYIFGKYSEALKNIQDAEAVVEQLLTEIPPFTDENGDIVYTLAHQFIKGYINYETGDIINNPAFHPDYDSVSFQQNLDTLG